MSHHAVFAFGPGDRWFMTSSTKWAWNNLPASVRKRILDTDKYSIEFIHHMVFGPNDSYYVGWRAKDGNNYMWHHGLPDNLATWLDEKDKKGYIIRKIGNLRITLGPNNGSYWASDGQYSKWWNLPKGLDEEIEELRKPKGGFTAMPRIVALGVDGTYFMVTENHGGAWMLRDKYPTLSTDVGEIRGHFDQIDHVSLDQHDAGHYVMTLKCGIASYDVPPSLGDGLKKVLTSIEEAADKAAAASSRTRAARQRQRTGFANLLTGVIAGVAGMSVQQPVYQGGGGVVNTGAFTAGLQQNMWSSVSDAASMPIQ